MTIHPEVSLETLHFNEPLLEFGFKQTTPHPKDGLFLYGPHAKARKPREVRVGVIGTPSGISYFQQWVKRIKGHVNVPPPGKAEKKDRLHLANFPGLEAAFGVSLNEEDFAAYPIDLKVIDQATRILNLHEAVSKVVVNAGPKARKDDGDTESIVLGSDVASNCFVLFVAGSSGVRLERLFPRPGLPSGGRSARRLSNARQRHRSHAPAWRGATV
jgi:hypothetical protein